MIHTDEGEKYPQESALYYLFVASLPFVGIGCALFILFM